MTNDKHTRDEKDEDPPVEEPDDREPDDRESDDREPDDREPDDQEPDDREPDDRESDDREPDDREPDDQEPDDREPDDREPDDRESDELHMRPASWQRHDALVVIGALALLAFGSLGYRTLTAPERTDFDEFGLFFERPVSWLPARKVPQAPLRLGADLVGRDEPLPTALPDADTFPLHVIYTSPNNALARLEVQITQRLGYSNLRATLSFSRRNRYGEFYWASDSRQVTIGARDWLRTRFRYAYKAHKNDSPRVATAIEYATVNGSLLYVVTLHGREQDAEMLAETVGPTLAVDTGFPGAGTSSGGRVPFQRRERSRLDAPNVTAAKQSTVMIVAVDLINDQLRPVAGGSGTIVADDGSILTNFHVIYDERREELHDLFLVARYRDRHREPELVCSGRPNRGILLRDDDLALIKCDVDMDGHAWTPTGWPAITIASADDMPVPSETIWILGYPDVGGGNITVTSGEVEGLTGEHGGANDEYIKTNASITRGNSGGSAVNEQGHLVGVPSAFRLRAKDTGNEIALVGKVGLVRPVTAAMGLIAFARDGWIPIEDENDLPESEDSEPAEVIETPSGVLISSRVIDVANDEPISGAIVVVFRPEITAADIDMAQLEEQALAWAQTNEAGDFALEEPIPRNNSYTVAVMKEGFRALRQDGALRLGETTPDRWNPWGEIRLERD